VVIALQARGNQFKYPYADNWRFALQRITAYITLIFIVLHLVHYRFADWFGIAGSYAAAHHAPGGFYKFTIESFQAGLMGIPTEAWVAIYVIGFLAAIYHFCNGIVTFCITWGFVIGDDSRKRVSLVAFALGGLLCLWAGLSIYALATVDPSLMDVQPGLDLQKAIQDLAEQTTG